MIERHDSEITLIKKERQADREEQHKRLADLRVHYEGLVNERFELLGQMHKRLIAQAAEQIEQKLVVPPEVEAAKLSGMWQFWASLASSVAAIVVAMIALLN